MQKLVIASVAVVLALVTVSGCDRTAASIEAQQEPASGSPAQAGRSASEETSAEQTGSGIAAIKQATQDNKYLFAFFWKEKDEQTAAMRKVFAAAMQKLADRANSVEIEVTAASEKAIVDKFHLDRAPTPLILVIAPNGAITGGFPTKVKEQELLEAFASPCMAKCMKQLQENRLVFLCAQNGDTKSNDEAMKGVRDFKADARFAQATEIVMLDPADTAEAGFLKDLQIDPKTETAVTVFLAPPGMPVAMYEGATSKDELVATLQKASSACGPGGSCGPGGCPPQ